MIALGMWRICGFYLLMAAIGGIAMGRTVGHAIVPVATWYAWGQSVAAGLGTGLTMVVATRLAVRHVGGYCVLAGEFRNLMAGLGPWPTLCIAVLSGTSEEILFRGALQPTLGFWVTVAIFGLLHVGPNQRFLPWTWMALVGGVIFGGLFAWSGNLVAPALAHVTVNFLNIRFLTAGDRRLVLSLRAANSRAVFL